MKKIFCAVTVLSLILVFAAFAWRRQLIPRRSPQENGEKPGGVVVEAVP